MKNEPINKHKILTLLPFLSIFICYFLFILIFRYEDTISFTSWSVEFWDCISSKTSLSGYYSYASLNPRLAPHGVPQGSWLTFLPWIIWNFPLFLFHFSPSSDVTSQLCIVYSKSFLLVCLVVTAVFIYKTTLILTERNYSLAFTSSLLLCGSLELFDSIAYTGQDEIVYLMFFTLSIFFAVSEKKKLALIFSVIAVTICPIMIIPAFFVICVYESKIGFALIKVCLCFVPTALFEIAYRNDAIYNAVKGNNTLSTYQIMMNTSALHTAIGTVSVPCIILCLLAFHCLFFKNKFEKKQYLISVLAITFICICFFMGTTFYRSCLYIPIFSLFICMSEKHISYKILMMLVISTTRFCSFLTNSYNFATRYLVGAVQERFKSLPAIIFDFSSIPLDSSLYIIRVFSFTALILLLLLHFCRDRIELNKITSNSALQILYGSQVFIFSIYFFLLLIL